MARRTLTSPKFWTLGAVAAGLVALVLLFGPGPDTSAHPGHTATVWEYEWKPGTVVYEWHHRNWYRTSRCRLHNVFLPHRPCVEWVSTGSSVEPRPPCATVPAWSATQPSGSTCDLHRSWIEDGTKYDWERHRTERTGSASRCQLPGSGLQPASRSTNTSPPGGQSTVYQSTNTAPSQYQGRCGTAAGGHRGAPTTTRPRPPPSRMARQPRRRRRLVIGVGRVRMISRWAHRCRGRCRRIRILGFRGIRIRVRRRRGCRCRGRRR